MTCRVYVVYCVWRIFHGKRASILEVWRNFSTEGGKQRMRKGGEGRVSRLKEIKSGNDISWDI